MEQLSTYLHLEEMNAAFAKIHLNRDGQLPIPFKPVFHHLRGPDDGDPHDHPFDLRIYVRRGWYIERIFVLHTSGGMTSYTNRRNEGDLFTIPAHRVHRIEQVAPVGCWTDAEYGPKIQEPSFYRFNDDGIFKRVWNSPEFIKQ